MFFIFYNVIYLRLNYFCLLKITDKDYFLPTIEALVPLSVMSNGRTQPLLINGVCATTGGKDDYVLKFKTGNEMLVQSSCNELVAAFIARELDLNVVEPALINVSEEFRDTLIGQSHYNIASESVGLNYGCKFVPGFLEFVKDQSLSEYQYFQAQQIFALDVFISNSDRRNDKQNMLTDGRKIIIFDHEMAFGFLYELIKNPTPWLIRTEDRYWITRHYFYNMLKAAKYNFGTFVESLDVIDNKFWDKVYTLVPKDWMGDGLDQIKNNLNSLVKNRSTFLQELNKVFS